MNLTKETLQPAVALAKFGIFIGVTSLGRAWYSTTTGPPSVN